MSKGYKYLNHSLKRVDAYDKVTGRARYTDDLSFAGMLYGGTLYSPHASARVVKIDTRPRKGNSGACGPSLPLPTCPAW